MAGLRTVPQSNRAPKEVIAAKPTLDTFSSPGISTSSNSVSHVLFVSYPLGLSPPPPPLHQPLLNPCDIAFQPRTLVALQKTASANIMHTDNLVLYSCVQKRQALGTKTIYFNQKHISRLALHLVFHRFSPFNSCLSAVF